jgi:hypothetical protein
MNDKFSAYDSVCFGVSAPLEPAWFPESSHLCHEAFDNGVEIFIFVRQQLFLGDFQPLVPPHFVHQGGDDTRYWIAQSGVEYRPEPGIDSAFHLQKEHRRVAHQVQEPRTSVGSWHRATNIRVHGTFDGRTI